jgi:WD40 repeat protein
MRRILILMMLLIFAPVHAQETPYLYYYSDVLNAFVIERADGTDSRILAEGLMPPETNMILDADWSPSGKWFAWQSGKYTGGNARLRGWIISADGEKRLTLLDGFTGITRTVWSPTEDLLAVVKEDFRQGFTFFLIDVEAEKIITSFELGSEQQDNYMSRIQWSPDGELLAFYYNQGHRIENERWQTIYFLRKVARTGQFVDMEAAPPTFTFTETIASPAISSNNWFIYKSADDVHLIAEHLSTHEKIQVEVDNRVNHILWNRTDALVFVSQGCMECNALWHFSTVTKHWREVTQSANFYDYEVYQQMWLSPDNRYITYRTTNNQFILFNTDTLTETVISDNVAGKWIWSEQSDMLVYQDKDEYKLLLYDLVSGETTDLNHDHWFDAKFSPDGQSLAVDHYSVFILDINSGESLKIRDHSAAVYASTYNAAFQWHGDWLLSSQIYFYASGGGGPRAVMVTNRDQSIRRELSSYVGEPGWLPEHVLPYLAPGQAESAVVSPTMTLTYPETVKGIVWLPDGTLITYAGNTLYFQKDGHEANSVMVDELDPSYCYNFLNNVCPLSVTPSNTRIVIGSIIFDLERLQIIETWETVWAGFSRWINLRHSTPNRTQRIYSSDKEHFARRIDHRTIEIVHTDSGEIIETFTVEDFFFIQWAGDWVLIVGGYNKYTLLNAQTGAVVLPEIPPSGFLSIRQIAVYDQFLAGASIYDRIHLWDLTDGSLIAELNWNAGAVAFSPDGRWLTAGHSQMVTLWDTTKIVTLPE